MTKENDKIVQFPLDRIVRKKFRYLQLNDNDIEFVVGLLNFHEEKNGYPFTDLDTLEDTSSEYIQSVLETSYKDRLTFPNINDRIKMKTLLDRVQDCWIKPDAESA